MSKILTPSHIFYQDCEAYIHSISTNSGSYPNSETFLYDFADYCAIVDKMSMSCKDQFKREKLGKTTCEDTAKLTLPYL